MNISSNDKQLDGIVADRGEYILVHREFEEIKKVNDYLVNPYKNTDDLDAVELIVVGCISEGKIHSLSLGAVGTGENFKTEMFMIRSLGGDLHLSNSYDVDIKDNFESIEDLEKFCADNLKMFVECVNYRENTGQMWLS